MDITIPMNDSMIYALGIFLLGALIRYILDFFRS